MLSKKKTLVKEICNGFLCVSSDRMDSFGEERVLFREWDLLLLFGRDVDFSVVKILSQLLSLIGVVNSVRSRTNNKDSRNGIRVPCLRGKTSQQTYTSCLNSLTLLVFVAARTLAKLKFKGRRFPNLGLIGGAKYLCSMEV